MSSDGFVSSINPRNSWSGSVSSTVDSRPFILFQCKPDFSLTIPPHLRSPAKFLISFTCNSWRNTFLTGVESWTTLSGHLISNSDSRDATTALHDPSTRWQRNRSSGELLSMFDHGRRLHQHRTVCAPYLLSILNKLRRRHIVTFALPNVSALPQWWKHQLGVGKQQLILPLLPHQLQWDQLNLLRRQQLQPPQSEAPQRGGGSKLQLLVIGWAP